MHALRLESCWHCEHTHMSCTWTYDPVTMHGSLKPAWDSVSWIVYAWMNFNGWKRYALGTIVCRHVQEWGTPGCRSRWQWSLSAQSLAVEPVGAWMRSMTPYTLNKKHGPRPQLICCCAHMLPMPVWIHVFIYFVFVCVGIVSEHCRCTMASF